MHICYVSIGYSKAFDHNLYSLIKNAESLFECFGGGLNGANNMRDETWREKERVVYVMDWKTRNRNNNMDIQGNKWKKKKKKEQQNIKCMLCCTQYTHT